MKRVQFIVVFLMLVLFSSVVMASNIEEILILGNDKTQKDVILQVLPFEEGDLWQEEYLDWGVSRLEKLNIFADVELESHETKTGGVLVVVEVTEGGLLANHLTAFATEKFAQIAVGEYSQTIHNPLGYGLTYFGHGSWNGMGIGVSGSLPQGWLYRISYTNADVNPDFINYNQHYQNINQQVQILLNDSQNPYWDQNYIIGYYSGNGDKYLVAKSETEFTYFDKVDLDLDLLAPVDGASPFVWRAGVAYTREQPITEGLSLLFVTKAGTLSPNTPIQLQYKAGGVSGELALRGSAEPWIASHYSITQLELEQQLVDGWSMLGFVDVGKFALGDLKPLNDWQYNPGVGIRYESPYDMIFNFDTVYSSMDYEWSLVSGIEFTY